MVPSYRLTHPQRGSGRPPPRAHDTWRVSWDAHRDDSRISVPIRLRHRHRSSEEQASSTRAPPPSPPPRSPAARGRSLACRSACGLDPIPMEVFVDRSRSVGGLVAGESGLAHFSLLTITNRRSGLAARFGKTGSLRTEGGMSVVRWDGWMECLKWRDRRRRTRTDGGSEGGRGHFCFLRFSFLFHRINGRLTRWLPSFLPSFPPSFPSSPTPQRHRSALARSFTEPLHSSFTLPLRLFSVSVAVRLSFTHSHLSYFLVVAVVVLVASFDNIPLLFLFLVPFLLLEAQLSSRLCGEGRDE